MAEFQDGACLRVCSSNQLQNLPDIHGKEPTSTTARDCLGFAKLHHSRLHIGVSEAQAPALLQEESPEPDDLSTAIALKHPLFEGTSQEPLGAEQEEPWAELRRIDMQDSAWLRLLMLHGVVKPRFRTEIALNMKPFQVKTVGPRLGQRGVRVCVCHTSAEEQANR